MGKLDDFHTPDPVDVHVGAKLRTRRKELGMSQQRLAEAVGVTFQQVQKYERAANRVSCSTLVRIAAALGTAPGYFVDDAPGAPDTLPTGERWALAQQIVATLPGAFEALLALRGLPGPIRRPLVVFMQHAANQPVIPAEAA